MLPSGYQVETGPKGLVSAFLTSKWMLHQATTPMSHAFTIALDHNVSFTKLWLWNIHLPVLYKSDEEKKRFVRKSIRPEIERVRASAPQRLEVVAGDFNLAPYSTVVLGDEGFYANRCLSWARGGESDDTINRRLYNPTWQIYGRTSPPYGTFYTSKVDEEGPWHMCDQVIMSAALALEGKLQVSVLDTAGGTNLCCKSTVRAPNKRAASDHLPLLVEFRAA